LNPVRCFFRFLVKIDFYVIVWTSRSSLHTSFFIEDFTMTKNQFDLMEGRHMTLKSQDQIIYKFYQIHFMVHKCNEWTIHKTHMNEWNWRVHIGSYVTDDIIEVNLMRLLLKMCTSMCSSSGGKWWYTFRRTSQNDEPVLDLVQNFPLLLVPLLRFSAHRFRIHSPDRTNSSHQWDWLIRRINKQSIV